MPKPPESASDDSARLIKASVERLFENLMDQTADRVYIKDRQSRFVYVSEALVKMHGLKDRNSLDGMTDFDFFSDENAQSAFDDEQEVMRTGVPIINRIVKELWQDGSVTWVSSSKVPLDIGTDGAVGLIGISRDVTEEILSKQQLAKSEQALREKNAIMQADNEGAEKVQRVMIPGRLPEVEGIDLAYIWKPMTEVGGDILSFPKNPYDCALFYIGDVCGHGVQAAFYTVLLKYLSSHAAESYRGFPSEFLDAINVGVSSQLRGGFITGMAGHFGRREANGGRVLHLSHAGHPYHLVYRCAEGTVEAVALPSSLVMGLPGGEASQAVQISLMPGDRFYTFTDGILESDNANGEEFGMERLIASVQANAKVSLQASIDATYAAVADFVGSPEQQDDITLLAFELS